MKVLFNNEKSYLLTFIYNFIFFDWLWKNLELLVYGELRPSSVDSIILLIFLLILTFDDRVLEDDADE